MTVLILVLIVCIGIPQFLGDLLEVIHLLLLFTFDPPLIQCPLDPFDPHIHFIRPVVTVRWIDLNSHVRYDFVPSFCYTFVVIPRCSFGVPDTLFGDLTLFPDPVVHLRFRWCCWCYSFPFPFSDGDDDLLPDGSGWWWLLLSHWWLIKWY